MDELRVIIRNNNDSDGITEKLIDELSSNFKLTASFVIDCGSERIRKPDTVYMKGYMVTRHDCVEFHKPCKPISKDILKAMLPYKSMAMDCMMRESDYDIYERGYMESVYYRILSYWNDFIDVNRINCLVYFILPHHASEFILYALGRVKNLKCVMLYSQIYADGQLYGIGSTIESMGENIKKEYERIKDQENDYKELSEYMRSAVDNVRNSRVMGDDIASQLIKIQKECDLGFVKIASIFDDIKHIARRIVFRNRLNVEDSIILNESLRKLSYRFKALKTERKMDHAKERNKYSIIPDYGERFIYYALHLQPESSTMPLAGEFKNQFLVLELLSAASKKIGIKVFVKEHWTQYHRERDFYKRISELENVYLIDARVNSIDLIENCICVVSSTGNVLFEAMVKQKPAMAFSDGYIFKGAPNIISPSSEKDIVDFLSDVLNGEYTISERNVINYLMAMDRCTVLCYCDSLQDEASSYYERDESVRIVVNYLKDIVLECFVDC